MIELLNRYSQGYVAVPVVVACRRQGLFALLEDEGRLSLEQIRDRLSANEGHLAVALRLLHGLTWLSRTENGYSLGPGAPHLEAVPDELAELVAFPADAYLRGEDALSLEPFLELSASRWNTSDPLLADNLDGALLSRVLLALSGVGVENDSPGAPARFQAASGPLFEELPEPARSELRAVFLDREWASGGTENLQLGESGRFVLEHAVVLGLSASYAPMLSRVGELLFGDATAPFAQAGRETHVERALNVKASGFLHRRYFEGVREVVVSIFDAKPVGKQPAYVVDTGCGDGTFLRSIYETVQSRTLRGAALDGYPLVLVGVDLNDEALQEAERTLAGLPHLLLRGDVADPEAIAAELERRGIPSDAVLHVRSFLDHDSHLSQISDPFALRARADVPYRGASVGSGGELVPQAGVVQGLVEHLGRWAGVVARHGMIVLEVHSIDPCIASRYRASTESLSFDAFQAFSLQYLVEASDFLLAAAEAGLYARHTFTKRYPTALPFTRISLNWFEKRPYRVRLARAADVPSLMEIEAAAWPEALSASRNEIERRLSTDPRGQLVVESEGRLVAVLYSQRIRDVSDLEGTTHRDAGAVACAGGRVLQLLGIFVHPAVQHLGIGDQLLELALQLADVDAEVEVVTGVTRCKNYPEHRDLSYEEYVRQVDDRGAPLDPIPLMHTSHGARIVKVIEGYRPEDVDNEGAGVLVTYDVRGGRAENLPTFGPGSSGPPTAAAAAAAAGAEESAAVKIERAVRKVLRPERESVFTPGRALMDMGLDSADLLELRVILGEQFALELDPTLFFRYPSTAALASYLTQRVEPDSAPASAATATPASSDVMPMPRWTKSLPRRHDAEPRTIGASPVAKIAVVGLGCRFPGAPDVARYWELLSAGRDAVGEAPPDRPWLAESPHGRVGGFLESIDRFDASLFGLSRREANHLDPQQRLLLETCWTALENAGIAPPSLAGTRTGVFLGIMSHDYELLQVRRGTSEVAGPYFASGNSLAVAAGRLAYVFGFRGPAISVDTACSSSLVAVHLACRSLLQGECDAAIASGVQLLLAPELTTSYARAGMLSKDGRCKTFDASANGYVRSEGVGVVVLKRLEDALTDGDDVLAVVRGSALNQDGSSNGLTAPSGAAQEEVVREALRQARVAPSEISYVETHGTGTSLGDPIEFEALASVYGDSRSDENPLKLGSVKTNIGHTEAAAGIAGLIKVVLALRHATLPAHLHFERPNPAIDLKKIPAEIPRTSSSWALANGTSSRMAAVSSFGFSGTNAHVVLEEWLAPPPRVPTGRRPLHLLTVSAASEGTLRELASSYAEVLRRDAPDLGDFAFSANTGRAQFEERAVIVAGSSGEAAERLDALARGLPDPRSLRGRLSPSASPKLAFLFSGQGSQFPDMGRELFASEPVFRRAIERCDEILKGRLDDGLIPVLFPSIAATVPAVSIDETAYTQPLLFALEYALAALWRSWGVEPAYVLGHSLGEYVAACVAGIIDLESALDFVAERGRLMQELREKGAMAAVAATVPELRERLLPYGEDLSIAAVNAPASVVVSGRTEALAELEKELDSRGVRAKRLSVSNAFHSVLVEPMLDALRAKAFGLQLRPSSVRLVSNLDGRLVAPEALTPDYWVRHAREPVRFADGIATLVAEGCNTFLEIGPGTTLLTLGRMSAGDTGAGWLPSLRPGITDWESMSGSLAELHLRGVAVDWLGYDAPHARRRVPVPNYPFSRERYWFDDTEVEGAVSPSAREDGGFDLESLVSEVESMPDAFVLETLGSNGAREEVSELERRLSRLSPERARLVLRRLLEGRRSSGAEERNVVHDYYDSLSGVWRDEKVREYEAHERFLTFGVFPDVVPGFSWSRTLTDPERDPEQFRIALEAQKELRSLLFRGAALEGRRVLDIGCGYGSDLLSLARSNPDLTAVGYTLSDRQAAIARRKVKEQGLEARVSITRGDSARDPFPGSFDLIIGFEVAHHVRDKAALFDNVADHLVDGGTVLLADFVSNAAFTIEHRETSSFFARRDEWVELLAPRGLLVEESVDVSREIANFLEDDEFQTTLREIAEKGGDDVRKAFRSYDQLGRLLRKGLASYVLLTVRKRSAVTAVERERASREALERPRRYAEVSPRGSIYELRFRRDGGERRERVALVAGVTLIVGDSRGLGSELASVLEKDGAVVALADPSERFERLSRDRFRVRATDADDIQRFVSEAIPKGGTDVRVVYMAALDASVEEEGPLDGELGLEQGPIGLLHLAQALARSEAVGVHLVLVTRGSHAALGDEPVAVAQSPISGFAAALRHEHPEWSTVVVDLDPDISAPPAHGVKELRDLLQSGSGSEPEVALRGTTRLYPRLVRLATPSDAEGSVRFRDASTLLITGGLGGIGLEVAAWAVSRGARHLLLCGRSAPSRDARETVERLHRRDGAEIVVERADVSRAGDVDRLMTRLGEMPPLRAIFHAAGTIDDAPLPGLTRERLLDVAAPKIRGAWLLHRQTLDVPLDFFVLFSSVVSLLGNAGQASYAAANAFLDALAERRRRQGKNATSIQWGPWASVGMASRLEGLHERRWSARGFTPLAPAIAIRALERVLCSGVPRALVAAVDWDRYRGERSGGERPTPLIEALLSRAESVDDAKRSFAEELARSGARKRRALLTDHVRLEVAKVLGSFSARTVDPERGFSALGMDSLMSVELRNRLQATLGLPLSSTLTMDYPNVVALAKHLDSRLSASTAGDAAPEASRISTAGTERSDLEKLSEHEAKQLLETLRELEH